MFNISTRGDYGLLLLSALMETWEGREKFLSLKKIAAEKKLSLPYLSQIVLPLKEAGFVESREGREGGYRLAKAPSEIRMIDVLEILEGPVSPVRCCSSRRKKCVSEACCGIKGTWQEAKKLLMDFLGKKTLKDLVIKK